jgi:hypothetical protein
VNLENWIKVLGIPLRPKSNSGFEDEDEDENEDEDVDEDVDEHPLNVPTATKQVQTVSAARSWLRCSCHG